MNRFEALDAAIAMIRILRPVIEKVARHDPSLAKQMKNAATSVASCLGEGNRRVGGDRPHLWRISFGSAGELQEQLRVVRAWGYLTDGELDASDEAVDRMCALVYRLLTPRR